MNILNTLTIGERKKIYLILAFTSLILFFLAVWQVRPVIVEPSAPLGLASYLPVTYWIGFALIMITGVLAVLDKELKKDIVFFIILLAVGLFIFGIRVFLYECAQDTDSYYPISIVYQLIRGHHLDIMNSPTLVSYYYWPALHFISASLLMITKVDLLEIMKYTPIFWIPSFILITYGIGKQLKLSMDRCFLLSILALSAWWLSFSGFYYPRLIAVMFFLIILMISLTPKTTISQSIVVIILSIALIISHGEIAIATMLGLILLSLYRHEYGLALIFIVILGAWYIFEASASLDYGIKYLLNFFRDAVSMTETQRYDTPFTSTGRLVARYSQLLNMVLIGIFTIYSLLLLLWHKIEQQNAGKVKALFAWGIGVALFVVFGMTQAITRTYITCIVPAVAIIIVSFPIKKLLVTLMCVFICLSLFVNYASLAGFGQVSTASLSGAKFFALQMKPNNYFSLFDSKESLYFDPDLMIITASNPPNTGAVSLHTADISNLDKYHYVVVSQDYSNALISAWGQDPYSIWSQIGVGKLSNFLYNNGLFQIYQNNNIQK